MIPNDRLMDKYGDYVKLSEETIKNEPDFQAIYDKCKKEVMTDLKPFVRERIDHIGHPDREKVTTAIENEIWLKLHKIYRVMPYKDFLIRNG